MVQAIPHSGGMKNSSRLTLILCCCITLSLWPNAQGEELFGMEVARGFSLRGVRMPLEIDAQRIGEVTIYEVGMGPRRIDAMMIHLIPQPVVHRMKVTVADREKSCRWRQALDDLLGSHRLFSQCRMEGLQISIPDRGGDLVFDAEGGMYGRGILILRNVTITRGKQRRVMPRMEIPLRVGEADWSAASVAP
jgi:hypothetical protein